MFPTVWSECFLFSLYKYKSRKISVLKKNTLFIYSIPTNTCTTTSEQTMSNTSHCGLSPTHSQHEQWEDKSVSQSDELWKDDARLLSASSDFCSWWSGCSCRDQSLFMFLFCWFCSGSQFPLFSVFPLVSLYSWQLLHTLLLQWRA